MIDEKRLSEVFIEDVSLRLVEPNIYSLYSHGEASSYDRWGGVYEAVACNRFYNRLVWGYWTSEYHSLCTDALRSLTDAWVLDAGCGSLAFTAKTYLEYSCRPVILLDQSLRMLMSAKSRLVKLNGRVPDNMVFLHGDVLQLPFKPKSLGTVISLNVLHALKDAEGMLQGLRKATLDEGSISLTTLAANNRLADRYLYKLGAAGALVPRSRNQLLAVFDALEMPVKYRIKGNLAFIHYGREINFFSDENCSTNR
jgi:SAM-dependent methyltransferase